MAHAPATKKPAPGKVDPKPISKNIPAAGIDFGDDDDAVEHRPEGKGEELIALNKIIGAIAKHEVIHKGQRFFCPDAGERERLLCLGAVKTVAALKKEQAEARGIQPIVPK